MRKEKALVYAFLPHPHFHITVYSITIFSLLMPLVA